MRSPSLGSGCKTKKKAVRGDGIAGNQGWGSAQREQLSSLHLTALLDVLPMLPGHAGAGPLDMSARDYGPAHLSSLLAKCTPCWDFYLIVTLSSILFTECLL